MAQRASVDQKSSSQALYLASHPCNAPPKTASTALPALAYPALLPLAEACHRTGIFRSVTRLLINPACFAADGDDCGYGRRDLLISTAVPDVLPGMAAGVPLSD